MKMRNIIFGLALVLGLQMQAQSRVYFDENYTWNATDVTKEFWRAITDNIGTGDTLVFRDMGSPYNVRAALKIFNANGLRVKAEPGVVIYAQAGYWEVGNTLNYLGINDLLNNYPAAGGTTDLTRNCKFFWFVNADNLYFEGRGAFLRGSSPGENPPEPDNNFNYSGSEYLHAFHIDGTQTNQVDNVKIIGFYIENWAGDGIKFEYVGNSQIKDNVIRNVQRNGVTVIACENPPGQEIIIEDFLIYNIDGTLPENGICFEPDFDYETIHGVIVRNGYIHDTSQEAISFAMGRAEGQGGADPLVKVDIYDVHMKNMALKNRATAQISQEWNGLMMQASDNPAFDPALTDPLLGLVSYDRCVVQNSGASFWWARTNDKTYRTEFNNTIFYNANTVGNVRIFDIQGYGESAVNHESPNVGMGNSLVYYTQNMAPFNFEDTGSTTGVLLDGDITIVSPWMGADFNYQNLGSLSQVNNTITTTKYTEGTFPGNTISVSVVVDNAVENTAQNAVVRFTRAGSTAFPNWVEYTVTEVGADCVMMEDYEVLNMAVVFEEGVSQVDIPIVPIKTDKSGIADRQIRLDLVDKATYGVGGNNFAVVTLSENPATGSPPPVSDPLKKRVRSTISIMN